MLKLLLFLGVLVSVHSISPKGVCTVSGANYLCQGSFTVGSLDAGSYMSLDTIVTPSGNFTPYRATKFKSVLGSVQMGVYGPGRDFTRQKPGLFGTCSATAALYQLGFATVPTPVPYTATGSPLSCTVFDDGTHTEAVAPYPYVMPRVDSTVARASHYGTWSTSGAYIYADTVVDTLYDRISTNSSFPVTLALELDGLVSSYSLDLLNPSLDYSNGFKISVDPSSAGTPPPAVLVALGETIPRAVDDASLLSLYPAGNWIDYAQAQTSRQLVLGQACSQLQHLAYEFTKKAYYGCVGNTVVYSLPLLNVNTTRVMTGYKILPGTSTTIVNDVAGDLTLDIEYSILAKPAPASVSITNHEVSCSTANTNAYTRITYNLGGAAGDVDFMIYFANDRSDNFRTRGVIGTNTFTLYTCDITKICFENSCRDLSVARSAARAQLSASTVDEASSEGVWYNPDGDSALFWAQIVITVIISAIVLMAFAKLFMVARRWYNNRQKGYRKSNRGI